VRELWCVVVRVRLHLLSGISCVWLDHWPQWKRGSPHKVTYSPFWSRPDRGPNFFAWASTDGTVSPAPQIRHLPPNSPFFGDFTGDQTNDPFFIPQVAKDILGLAPHGEIGIFFFILISFLHFDCCIKLV
jgi:hypothetical protein